MTLWDDTFHVMTNKFDDRFAERHHGVSSGTVITECHHGVSSRRVITFGVIGFAVYSHNGLLLSNIPYSLPPSLLAAVLDMPEEIEESIPVAFQRVLLRMGCAEIYFCHYWNNANRFFLGGKNGSKQERERTKTHLDLFGGDEPGTARVFQVHELFHRKCECGHEGSGVGE